MKKVAKHFATRYSTKETANLLQEHMNRAKLEESKVKEAANPAAIKKGVAAAAAAATASAASTMTTTTANNGNR